MEALVAGAALVALGPILLILAVAVALSSKGPFLFQQKRVGRGGRTFTLLKFRTMRSDGEGAGITASGDPRVTPLGRFLRKAKLDELPELWNVFVGDMSFVGPRPEVVPYVDLTNPLWQQVLKARPGITDPVTLRLRNEEALLSRVDDREGFYLEQLQPLKLRGYLKYLNQRSWRSDLRVIWTTLLASLFPQIVPAPTVREISASMEESILQDHDDPLVWRSLVIKATQFALDLEILIASFVFAYLLRFDFVIPESEIANALAQAPVVIGIQLLAMALAGIFAFVWRYIGMAEIRSFIRAAVWSAIPIVALRLGLPSELHQYRVPLSVICIDTILAFGGVFALRVLRRSLHEQKTRQDRVATATEQNAAAAILVGAGRAGVLAAREIVSRGNLALDVKGFVDDDVSKIGSVISGFKVLGTTEDLPRLVRTLGIKEVVLTLPDAAAPEMRRIVSLCQTLSVKVRVIPGLYEILEGKVEISRLRSVEIEDLLGRAPVQLDSAGMRRFLGNKRVLLTGAGGSIGSELARQIVAFKPSELLLLDRAEFALFEIDSELRRTFQNLRITPLVGDVGDRTRIRAIFGQHRPEVVIHAAAHKHVPLMESNPTEAITNNVLGTETVALMAGEFGAETFVMISTDKAVNPTSMMGASKRIAELVIQDASWRFSTRYVAVRFGNVLGSAGSVIPIFRKQIEAGGPVTVTHPEMQRYFMTIPEACQLSLQAGALGKGGEIFVLDMGTPMKIVDLAEQMIRLSGRKPYEEIPIVFTGMRPGEKLFEELEGSRESHSKTVHPKIFVGSLQPCPMSVLQPALQRLYDLAYRGADEELYRAVAELLPEAQLRIGGNASAIAGPEAPRLHIASEKEEKRANASPVNLMFDTN